MASYPTSADSLSNPAAGDKTNSVTVPHATQHTNANDILEALMAKVGIGSYTPARNKALIGGSSGSVWDKVARKDYLYNGGMRVAQRSSLGSTDNSYTLDRWRLLLEAANAATVTQETSDVPSDGSNRALKLTVGSGEDNKFGIFQVLEFLDVAHLRGKAVSLQFKMKATSGIGDVRAAICEFTGTADSVSGDPVSSWGSAGTNPTLAANWAMLNTPANLSPTTNWATYRVENVSVGASMNNLAVLIWCDDETTTQTTDILRITDAQLEEGLVCTEVEARPYVDELDRCMRYYEEIGSGVTNENFASGEWITATEAICNLSYKVRKRTAPSVSVSAASDFQLFIGASNTACTSFTTQSIGLDAAGVRPGVAAGATAGHATNWFSGSANARIKLNSEL